MPIAAFRLVAPLNLLLVGDWQDRHVLAFEGWLFPEPPTVWLGRFASPLVTEVVQIGYFSYYFMLIVVGGVLYRRTDRAPFVWCLPEAGAGEGHEARGFRASSAR